MRVLVLGVTGLLLALPGAVRAAGEPQLVGTVGPADTIVLKDSQGNTVTSLAPGTYDVLVHDLASSHNFHLSGPGVNKATTEADTGDTTWEDIVFQAGTTYTYVCDPHSSIMYGSFTTGAAPPPPPGPPPPGPPPGPPPPSPPPPPAPPVPPPPPHLHMHPLEVVGVRITVERRRGARQLVARARINHAAVARLALMRGARTRASARKRWVTGANTIRTTLPRSLPRGRWVAELRVSTRRFKRTVRIG